MESLINTVRLFSEDIRMQFGVDNCAITVMKRGKLDSSYNDIIFENQDTIRSRDEKNCYKYLGVLEVDNIKHQQIKSQLEKKYVKGLRKILKSKLNSGKLVTSINTWAVSLVRYRAGVIEWTQQELENIDRRTRNMMHLYSEIHPRAEVDRLYVQRNEGGRGLMSILDTVRNEEQSMIEYIRNKYSEIMTTIQHYTGKQIEENRQRFRKKQKERRNERWQTKVIHRQHVRQTKDFAAQNSWQWLWRGSLKRQTGSLIIAAQDQALGTNYRKARLNTQENRLRVECARPGTKQ